MRVELAVMTSNGSAVLKRKCQRLSPIYNKHLKLKCPDVMEGLCGIQIQPPFKHTHAYKLKEQFDNFGRDDHLHFRISVHFSVCAKLS